MTVLTINWDEINLDKINEPLKKDILRLIKIKPDKVILYRKNNEYRLRKYNVNPPKNTKYHNFVKQVSKILPELGINKIWTITIAAKLWRYVNT